METRCGCGGLQVSQRPPPGRDAAAWPASGEGRATLRGQAARAARRDSCHQAGPQASEPGKWRLSPVLPGHPQRTRQCTRGKGPSGAPTGWAFNVRLPLHGAFPVHTTASKQLAVVPTRGVSSASPTISRGLLHRKPSNGGACGPCQPGEAGGSTPSPFKVRQPRGDRAPTGRRLWPPAPPGVPRTGR